MIEDFGAYSSYDYKKGYRQGISDAVDECIKILKFVGTDEWTYWELMGMFNHLKEQRNE